MRSEELVVLIHGWPDDASLWDSLAAALSDSYTILRITLPQYGSNSNPAVEIPQLIENIHSEIKAFAEGRRVTLIGHDWGAFLSYLLEARDPGMFDSLITLDVGAHIQPKSAVHGIVIVAYQWWLILAWGMGKVSARLGDAMAAAVARVLRVPWPERAKARMGYLYFQVWRAALLGGLKKIVLPGYRPTVPVFYLYGARKPFHFHSGRWLKILAADTRCRVLAVERAGHWLMLDQPELVNREIRSWLDGRRGG